MRLPEELVPRPVARFEPWWEATAEGRLLVQRCLACRHLQLYPRGHCLRCWKTELELVEASGRGTIHSVTATQRNPEPAFDPPYAYAIVSLEEGPRLTTLIRAEQAAAVEVGDPVRAVFESAAEGISLPFFELADGTGPG